MPYFCLGYTSFTNANPTLTGTSTAKADLDYDIDTGAGWSGGWTTLTGAHLAAESINETTGFKLKVRATCNATADCKLTYIRIDLTTDATAQQTQYPLDLCTVTCTGLATGSRVKIYKVSDGTLLDQAAETANAVSFETTYVGAIYLEARCATAAPYYKPWVTQLTTISGDTVTAVALQELDQ